MIRPLGLGNKKVNPLNALSDKISHKKCTSNNKIVGGQAVVFLLIFIFF